MPITTRYKLQLGRFAHAPSQGTTQTNPAPLAHPSTESAASQSQARPAEEGKAPEQGGPDGPGLTADFWLDYREGETLGLLYALSEQAKRWRRHHVDPDALEYNGAIAIEHRYIRDITDAIRAHGLRLEVN